MIDTKTLQANIGGSIVQRGDDAYEAVRLEMAWNQLKPQRYPEVIVRVASEADVPAAIRFARRHHLKVAVRGGGHSWCHAPIREDGMLLDLSGLKNVSVDVAARTAAVQPGVSGRELMRQLSADQLAFPVGHCPSVPISGFVLAGGLGWNGRMWGPACLSLLEIDVVTADGALVTANEHQHADLLWAARGAGAGFFGVVTKFRLRLHPLPSAIRTSRFVYPLECLDDVVGWMAEAVGMLSKQVELFLLLETAPSAVVGQSGGSSSGKVCIVSATAFADTEEEAAAALSPVSRCPVVERCVAKQVNHSTPFEELFDAMDRVWPEGPRYVADTLWSNSPSTRVLTAIEEHFTAVPSSKSVVLSVISPPATDPASLPNVAFSMVAPVYVVAYSIWEDADHDTANIEWLRQAMVLLEPFGVGHYLGESDLVANPSRAQQSFAKPNWQRLQALRERYDPDGVFHSYIGSGP